MQEGESLLSMGFGGPPMGHGHSIRDMSEMLSLRVCVQLAAMRSRRVDQHGQYIKFLDFAGLDASGDENEHNAVTGVGFLLAPLSCGGNGSGFVLWALTGRTKTEQKACSLLRGLSQRWEAVMDESLIKDPNEILKADGGAIWGDSQNSPGDWVSHLLQLCFA